MNDINPVYNFSKTGDFHQNLKSLKKLNEDIVTEKIMPDGKVFEPIKVFEEGEYVTSSRNGKMVKFKATKERMEKWVTNSYRDVPFNLDHQKESISEIGWLRTASGNTYVDIDEKTGKYALYTQPEFTQEAYDKYIARARYRDVSLEIDPDNDFITGIALTNYPRLKTLTQMSELSDLDRPASVQDDGTATKPTTVVVEIVQKDVEMTEPVITEDIKTAEVDLKAQYEAEFSVLRAEIAALKEAKEKAAADALRNATILEMSKKVDKLILSEDGKSIIPAGVRAQAIELFCHLADKDEVVLFSETGDEVKTSATDLLTQILEAQVKFSEVMQRSPLDNGTNIDAKLDADEGERPGVAEALRKIYQKAVVQ